MITGLIELSCVSRRDEAENNASVVNAVENKVAKALRPHSSSSSVKPPKNLAPEMAKIIWFEASLVRTSIGVDRRVHYSILDENERRSVAFVEDREDKCKLVCPSIISVTTAYW